MSSRLKRPRIREDLSFRELDDGGVIYDSQSDRVHTLNLTAAFIWNSCNGNRSVEQIALEICELARLSPEQGNRDVAEAIGQFEREGLLQVG